MKFPGFDHRYTGILVPVAALRSQFSAGIGEFLDIVPLADWCRTTGMDMIQILPVNDTGDDSSPYSAVSAFALNPAYLRISALPELDGVPEDHEVRTHLRDLAGTYEATERVRYVEVLRRKLEIVQRIFDSARETIAADRELEAWAEANPWLKSYAVYKVLRAQNEDLPWTEWTSHRDPTAQSIESHWNDPALAEELSFHVWLQYRLEEQLNAAAEYAESCGVCLKGDLPILMNEDSADIWAHRDIFIPELRAGAPPDMFSRLGQNWDFPVYEWNRLAEQEYDWWKRRLRQADKFYHAYRIDHVLGFFRIWAIPYRNVAGTMGFFYPSALISDRAMEETGFDQGRIRWLAYPHLPAEQLEAHFGDRTERVVDAAFRRIDGEELYLLKDEIRGERDILELDLTEDEKSALLEIYRDRALLPIEADGAAEAVVDAAPGAEAAAGDHGAGGAAGGGEAAGPATEAAGPAGETSGTDGAGRHYAPTWEYRECSRFQQLSDEERQRFEELVAERNDESERIWEEQGRMLLSFMNSTVPMLTCAEDLGVIPECVPRTLSELGILGMRVPRWARRYELPEEPYIDPQEYPFLTVCAPSVHDTSTLREWWEREADRQEFWTALGLPGEAPQHYGPEVCRRVLGALFDTSSAICMVQIQDLFALDATLLPEDPAEERVNVPGTYNEWNWGYRLPLQLEKLHERDELTEQVQELVTDRRRKQI